jgi:hypothetical protein
MATFHSWKELCLSAFESHLVLQNYSTFELHPSFEFHSSITPGAMCHIVQAPLLLYTPESGQFEVSITNPTWNCCAVIRHQHHCQLDFCSIQQKPNAGNEQKGFKPREEENPKSLA